LSDSELTFVATYTVCHNLHTVAKKLVVSCYDYNLFTLAFGHQFSCYSILQDHIVSAVLLSKQDTFLTREEYHQLLYASCLPPAVSNVQPGRIGQKVSALNSDDEIQPLPPAIWKPKPLWTGKQVCVIKFLLFDSSES